MWELWFFARQWIAVVTWACDNIEVFCKKCSQFFFQIFSKKISIWNHFSIIFFKSVFKKIFSEKFLNFFFNFWFFFSIIIETPIFNDVELKRNLKTGVFIDFINYSFWNEGLDFKVTKKVKVITIWFFLREIFRNAWMIVYRKTNRYCIRVIIQR